MKNAKALELIYKNINELIEDHEDFPETKEASDNLWKCITPYLGENLESSKKIDLECAVYDLAFYNERQGFLFGFNYALELLRKSE